jgi:hypothetical protein
MKMVRLAVIFGAALIVSFVGVSPAMARSDTTLTVTCSGGQVIVSDANSLHGQTTATGVYNSVNPFGEICVVNP